MLRITGTTIGLPLAPAEAMVMEPVYCATARPVPETCTCTVPGVVPVAGVALNHAALAELVTLKVKLDGLPVTAMVCAAGAEPPTTCVNVRVVVGAEIVPGATVKVTAMVAGLLPAPGAVTTMAPL